MISDRKRGADFYDNLVSRLQAGDSPDALRVELNIGAGTMARYVSHARNRTKSYGG